MTRALSVLIPARNELFLTRTVAEVLKQRRGNTEVIVVLDGAWPEVPLPHHPDVTVVYHPTSVGQRAATNEAARLSSAEYIMKLDAHCALDEGFDVKLMADCAPDWTVVPRMYNLHAFDWVCDACGHRTYMGPDLLACGRCNAAGPFHREEVWLPRLNRRSDFARFDRALHFQYWGGYGARPEAVGDLADTMCQIGACWFMRRERFWQLGGLDEAHGSWGQMGVEISCKSWLSGGRQVVNKKTWFAHMFRTRDGFGFPYPMSGNAVERARAHSRRLWQGGTWPGAVHDLQWLIDKFAPVPDWNVPETPDAQVVDEAPAPSDVERWTQEEIDDIKVRAEVRAKALGIGTKGCAYYTDGRLDETIQRACWQQLVACGLPIAAVSLRVLPFIAADVVTWERGHLTMFRQILRALESLDTEFAFLTEHDVLYHPSHFDFVPPRADTVYYNQNVWKVDAASGRALYYDVNQTSGVCANRALLVAHYRRRVVMAEQQGFTRRMGFEPGTRKIRHGGVDDLRHDCWRSELPNVDIRHGTNLTASRWRKDEFRDQRYTRGWTEADAVPGWGTTRGRITEILQTLATAATA